MNPSTTTPQRFPPLLIALHWLTLLLAVAVVVLMEFKGNFPKGSPERTAMVAWHYTLGITLLVVTALRLVVRLRAVRPPIVPPSPKWQERVAFLVEVGLYVLLIGLPILGWLTVSAWQRQWPLHVQQWVFLGCSLLGLWNWWLGPALLG